MRRLLLPLVPLLAVALAAPVASASDTQQLDAGQGTVEYVVVYGEGATDAARDAIAAAGGQIERENTAVGVATVRSSNADFMANAASQPGVEGVAHNTTVGSVPRHEARPRLDRDAVEKEGRVGLGGPGFGIPGFGVPGLGGPGLGGPGFGGPGFGGPGFGGPGFGGLDPRPNAEPLADLQWDMQQINATADGSYRYELGDPRVLVGIIDTGIDGNHPDIAPNFARDLSRNFTVDIPVDANGDDFDGPCADEPDQSCNDPADVDEDGHGTHVASTIGAPINGLGIAGVAPNVTLVNLRAGQDSGFFFTQATVDALTYAGDIGVDVVNMSYYVDPWLFNCADNPADSPTDQAEQRAIITAVQRVLDYAHAKGVTLVAAAGNEAIDYTKTNIDETSPDFASKPGEAPYARTIPPSCISIPSEGNNVIPVSATGRSTRKSYYSSFGSHYVDVAAPGGDVYDTPDGSRDITGATLAAYPESVGLALGDIDPDTGEPTNEFVVRDCNGSTCAYYQYLQGTSMASPHAVGVAALIVSKYGYDLGRGYGLMPLLTKWRLLASAQHHECPRPNTVVYVRFVPQEDGSVERVESEPQTCEGNLLNNGFYGWGIIDARAAVGHLR